MTLFTATGLLLATTRRMTRGISGTYTDYIRLSYTDWYRTQSQRYPPAGKFSLLLAGKSAGAVCLQSARNHLSVGPQRLRPGA